MPAKQFVHACAVVLTMVLTAGTLLAQTTFSTIRGTVTDQTGAVVPGVEVNVTEVTTNLSRTVQSSAEGNFEVPNLKVGTYRLTGELSGFKTFVADNITLDSAQLRRIDVVLEIGETTQEIVVEAGAEVISTEGGSIIAGFENKIYDDIPLVDTYPGPLSMLATLPGVQGDGWVVSMAGQKNLQITQMYDGVQNDRTGPQGANVNLYEEVQVVTVNNTADQSRVASYNTIAKSGNNQFHGELYYKHVNSALNAREYFDPTRIPFLFHEWLAEGSGPVIKDKTFIYGAYFSERFPAGSYKRANVPSMQMRQGDFSQFSNAIMDPLTGEPFPNNRIPSERLNPTSLKTQDLYIPEPNLGDANTLTNNFGFNFPWPSDKFQTDMFQFRVDHNLSQKNSIFFRYNSNRVPYVLARQLPAFSWTRRRSYSKAVISDTHIFSPSLVNNFTFGWNGNYMFDGDTVDGHTPPKGDDAISSIGLQGVNPKGLSEQGFPRMDIAGLSRLRTIDGGLRDDHFDFSWADTMTWTHGNHVTKMGFQLYKYNDFEALAREGTYGRFNFNGKFTGNAFGDFLLGMPLWSRRLDVLIPREMESVELGLYFMDTYKATQNLTLDYGLRWDYFGSDTIKDGLQYNWDSASGNVIIPSGTESQVSPLYPNTINLVTGDVVPSPSVSNFRPRIGIAYRLSDSLVLRGGYGVFTERLGYFSRVQKTGPFEISETYFNDVVDGQPLFTFPNPFPADVSDASTPSQSVVGYPMNTSHASIHQFNVSIEKEVKDIGLRASYVGTRSRGLNYSVNINKPAPGLTPFTAARRPFSQFINTNLVRNDGSSNYNSLQLQAKKRAGLITFDAHYTLASNLHNWLNTQNPYDVTSHWSNDNFIARHRAVFTTQTELPFGQGRRYLPDAPVAVDAFIGGWVVTSVSYFQTGPHFSPSFTGSDPSNTNTFGGLPDRVCDGNITNRTVERWFDPSCFAVPPPGRFGNSAPNVLVSPGMNVHHLSLAKRFNIGERVGIIYTIAASNIFNHPHFLAPRTNISTPNAGELFNGIQDWRAEKHASRKFQMKLRIEW